MHSQRKNLGDLPEVPGSGSKFFCNDPEDISDTKRTLEKEKREGGGVSSTLSLPEQRLLENSFISW